MTDDPFAYLDIWQDLPESAALKSDLDLYIKAVAEFFPYISKQLPLRLAARHALEKDTFFSEELEAEAADLEKKISGPLARSILGSVLVTLYSAVESTSQDLAAHLAAKYPVTPFNPRSGTGEFLSKIQLYFLENLGLEHSTPAEAAALNILKALRHSFVHEQSSFQELPQWLKQAIKAKDQPLAQCKVWGPLWVPSYRCVELHTRIVRGWADGLFTRAANALVQRQRAK